MMSFIGYKVTLFLLNNLWLCKLFAVLWLFFYDFLWESHIRKSFFMPKMKCWYYLTPLLEPILKCDD